MLCVRVGLCQINTSRLSLENVERRRERSGMENWKWLDLTTWEFTAQTMHVPSLCLSLSFTVCLSVSVCLSLYVTNIQYLIYIHMGACPFILLPSMELIWTWAIRDWSLEGWLYVWKCVAIATSHLEAEVDQTIAVHLCILKPRRGSLGRLTVWLPFHDSPIHPPSG